ncbi:unnamed protein product [Rotaria sp. Silwood1]|nr:unnamed protein product [Rotaria sp. Silwood1]
MLDNHGARLGNDGKTDDHPIKHYLSPLSLTNTDDIFIKALRKNEDFGIQQ